MLDPQDKVYLEQAQSAVFIQASPDQLLLAKKLIDDIDRPKRTYRLIYTITRSTMANASVRSTIRWCWSQGSGRR